METIVLPQEMFAWVGKTIKLASSIESYLIESYPQKDLIIKGIVKNQLCINMLNKHLSVTMSENRKKNIYVEII